MPSFYLQLTHEEDHHDNLPQRIQLQLAEESRELVLGRHSGSDVVVTPHPSRVTGHDHKGKPLNPKLMVRWVHDRVPPPISQRPPPTTHHPPPTTHLPPPTTHHPPPTTHHPPPTTHHPPPTTHH